MRFSSRNGENGDEQAIYGTLVRSYSGLPESGLPLLAQAPPVTKACGSTRARLFLTDR